MNRAQLVEAVAKDVGLSKAQASAALDSVLANVTKGAKKGSVGLVGFGTFKEVKVAARIARNPATGAKVKVPAKKVMKFKASKNPKF